MKRRTEVGKRKVRYSRYLPKIGDVVRIYVAELNHLPFEAVVIGRGPFGTEKALANKLPNEEIILKEAVFCLSFAPNELDRIISCTDQGWEVCFKDTWKKSFAEVERIE